MMVDPVVCPGLRAEPGALVITRMFSKGWGQIHDAGVMSEL